MPCRSIHGVHVGWDAEGLGAALLEELLAPFPEVARQRGGLAIRCTPAAGDRPRPPAGARQVFFNGEVRGYAASGAIWLTDGTSTALVEPSGRSVAVQAARASLARPDTFLAGFLFVALAIALRHHGLFHVHAAVLRHPRGGSVLVGGTAGSGKSSLALALISAGCRYLGDDAALLAWRRAGASALAFPKDFHVGPRTAAAFPALRPHLGRKYGERRDKRVLEAGAAFPGRLRREARAPWLLLFPELELASATRVSPLAPAEAFGLLLHASALGVVDGMPAVQSQLELLRSIADRARGFRVGLGTDALADHRAVAHRLLALAA